METLTSQIADLFVLTTYYGVLGLLVILAIHRFWLLMGLRGTRHESLFHAPARLDEENLPAVTVQLPIYNEPLVVERLIGAVCTLDYPRERIDIQVLDDSTDETSVLASRAIACWKRQGVRIVHIRRANRTGYKAGALAHGLALCHAELVAVFDADFVPQPGFLRRLVGEFQDANVGMVQARWGHLNARESLLAALQALLLDGHFRIEHAVRCCKRRFFNFNGTAGIWRRAAIDDAGGWEHDTLTEDLDLSLRAQLRGWRFVYRGDVEAPAELPASMSAFRSQQRRWAKGSAETARKLLLPLWRSRVPFKTKADATAMLAGNLGYLLLLVLSILAYPLFQVREHYGLRVLTMVDVAALFPATGALVAYFLTVGRLRGYSWLRTVLSAPAVMALGIGMSLNNGLAVLDGILGRRSAFVRTPKSGSLGTLSARPQAARFDSWGPALAAWCVPLVELALAATFLLLMGTAGYYGVFWALPFSGLFAAGFGMVGFLGLGERFLALRFAGPPGRFALPSGLFREP